MMKAYMSIAGARAVTNMIAPAGMRGVMGEAELARILGDSERLDPKRPTCAYARIHADRTIGPVYVAEAFDSLAEALDAFVSA